MNQGKVTFHPPLRVIALCALPTALGAVALFFGLREAPERAWPNLLLLSYYLLSLGLGGLVFVALQYVTGATWSVGLRRVPEAMAAILPVAALGLAFVFLARPSLYPWARGEVEVTTPLRHAWFQPSFFLGRAALYVAAWLLLAVAIVRTSRRQDNDGDPAHTRMNVRLSALFLVVFAVTFWLASTDWLLSLQPKWSSTIFSVYQFGGLFLGGLAGITLLSAWLYRLGPFRQVLSGDRLHDLGKLLFAFSTFWMYLWFCQYMLIWYVNSPEETGYFIRRLEGAWRPLFYLNVVLNWAIPFVVLLPRAGKRRAGVLAAVSVVVLAGRWLDLYVGILPEFGEPAAAFAYWEIGLAAGAAGLFALVCFAALGTAEIMPVADPLRFDRLPAPGQNPGTALPRSNP